MHPYTAHTQTSKDRAMNNEHKPKNTDFTTSSDVLPRRLFLQGNFKSDSLCGKIWKFAQQFSAFIIPLLKGKCITQYDGTQSCSF